VVYPIDRTQSECGRAGLELNPDFTIARLRTKAFSDHPSSLAGRERAFEGMRKAGAPPTWREHLLSDGRRLDTADDLDRVLSRRF
jgi:hypothetical protein